MKRITGCILVGGKSSRMGGGIKSLKKFNNKSILDRIVERSKNQVDSLAINTNNNYNNFKKYNLPIFSDYISGYLGPLAGIHASLKWSKYNNPKNKWVMTFASDTPFFPQNIVEKLYDKAIKSKKQIILAKSFGRNHSVFGLWNVDLEKNLSIALLDNNIRKIDEWVNKNLSIFVNFTCKKYDPFFNINTPEDLLQAKNLENQFLIK